MTEPHPTETPPPTGLVPLTDDAAPDFLERHRVVVLLFLDPATEASRKVEERATRIALALTGAAGFGVLDVRRDPLVARALGVGAVPEMVVFVDGESVDRLMGVVPEAVVRDAVGARVAAVRGGRH